MSKQQNTNSKLKSSRASPQASSGPDSSSKERLYTKESSQERVKSQNKQLAIQNAECQKKQISLQNAVKTQKEQQDTLEEIRQKSALYSRKAKGADASIDPIESGDTFYADDREGAETLKVRSERSENRLHREQAESYNRQDKKREDATEKLSARKSSFSEERNAGNSTAGDKNSKTKNNFRRSRLSYGNAEKSMADDKAVHGRKSLQKAAAAAENAVLGNDDEEASGQGTQESLQEEFSSSLAKARRGGKNYIDYVRDKQKEKEKKEEKKNASFDASDEDAFGDGEIRSAKAYDSEADSIGKSNDAVRDHRRYAEGKEKTAIGRNRYTEDNTTGRRGSGPKESAQVKTNRLQERESKLTTLNSQESSALEAASDTEAGSTVKGIRAKSNEVSRKAQKKKIKVAYAMTAANKAAQTDTAAAGISSGTAAKGAGGATAAAAGGAASTAFLPIVIGIVCFLLFLLILFLLVFLSFGGISGTTTATTYQASNNDILDMNNQYEKLEEELQQEIKRTPDDYPDYDEYEYELDEISHSGNVLASYFTALKGDFKSGEISEELKDLFSRQYEIIREERTETRTKVEPQIEFDDQGNATTTYVEVEYEARILKTKLINHNLSEICQEKLGSELSPRYLVYLEAVGNRPELFGENVSPDDLYAYYYKDGKIDMNVDDLPDTAVGRMLQIAHDQENKPYIYGAAHGADYYSDNPSAFDCSSFVSWVLKNSIAKDDFACRDTNGLKRVCDDIDSSQAQPGDLIFFKNTYDYPGISHVGIYIGDNQMIHAGNPVKVSKIDTQYWQSHFVGFGRLKAEYQR